MTPGTWISRNICLKHVVWTRGLLLAYVAFGVRGMGLIARCEVQDGGTPFWNACINQNFTVVMYLLQVLAPESILRDCDKQSTKGIVDSDDVNMVYLYLDKTHVPLDDYTKATVLHLALYERHTGLLMLLHTVYDVIEHNSLGLRKFFCGAQVFTWGTYKPGIPTMIENIFLPFSGRMFGLNSHDYSDP